MWKKPHKEEYTRLRAELIGHEAYVYGGHARTPLEAAAQMGAARFAPALVGPGQYESGYVPCRIFKTIAAGSLGVTNSPTLRRLFLDEEVTSPEKALSIVVRPANDHAEDFLQLFEAAEKVLEDRDAAMAKVSRAMEIVRDRHTYLNRLGLAIKTFAL